MFEFYPNFIKIFPFLFRNQRRSVDSLNQLQKSLYSSVKQLLPKAKLASDNVFYEQMARRQRIKDVCSEFANEPGIIFLLFFCYFCWNPFDRKYFDIYRKSEVQKCCRKLNHPKDVVRLLYILTRIKLFCYYLTFTIKIQFKWDVFTNF